VCSVNSTAISSVSNLNSNFLFLCGGDSEAGGQLFTPFSALCTLYNCMRQRTLRNIESAVYSSFYNDTSTGGGSAAPRVAKPDGVVDGIFP